MPLLLEPKFCREKREKHEAHKRGRSQHGLGQRPRGSKDLRMLLSRSRKALEVSISCFPASSACWSLSVSVFRAPFVGHSLVLVKGLQNSTKLSATPCRATQDGRIVTGRSDKTWSTEEDTATHSSTLAWTVPWTEEPGGLQSLGSQKSQTRLSD